MAVTADAVLIAQENPGVNRSRILRIQRGNPQFSAFKTGTAAKDMLDLFVG